MAKKSTNTTPSTDTLKEYLAALPINDFLYAVSEASKEQQKELKGFVAEMVNRNIQQHLDEIELVPAPDLSIFKPSVFRARQGQRAYDFLYEKANVMGFLHKGRKRAE